ncbi:MAG: glycosyltransferase family 4 protein [Verrucomicrobia bacterium]|nr:glycosyltransferase family 4 protein [Verrucomicrobiota bacterium]
MHILLTIHAAQIYGAANSMLTHALALRERGYEFTVLLNAHGPLEQALRRHGIPCVTFPFVHFGLKRNPWRWDLPVKAWQAMASRARFILHSYRLLRRLNRPLVHVHSTLVFHAALAAWLAGCRVLWHVREERTRQPYSQKGRWYRWSRQIRVEARRLVVRLLADRLVYVSESIRNKYGLPRTPSDVVFNYLDMPAERPEREADGVFRVLYVGRLTFEKGADDFLRICRGLLDRQVPFTAVMAGDGAPDYLTFHRRRIRELGLEARVQLAGYQENMQALYAQTDVLLFPSQTEAFPRAVMEAMAYGRPVVASGVGGIPEMIEHGRSGFLFRLDHPDEAVEALCRLARDRDLGREIGTAARERAAKLFSRDVYADRMDRVYREMTKKTGRQNRP